jgi:hypothetical protein
MAALARDHRGGLAKPIDGSPVPRHKAGGDETPGDDGV